MRIIQLAQTEPEIARIKKCLREIFNQLAVKLNATPRWDQTYTMNVSIEKHDEADPQGESWIQVSHSRNNISPSENSSIIYVERYFENELAQNAYGKTIKVRFNWLNVQEATQKILAAVESLREQV